MIVGRVRGPVPAHLNLAPVQLVRRHAPLTKLPGRLLSRQSLVNEEGKLGEPESLRDTSGHRTT